MTFDDNHIIKFSENWNNKLDCKYFTTIRLHNPKKYIGGQVYGIEFKKVLMDHAATIMQIKTFYLKDLNEFMAGLDTGYSRFETEKIIRTMYRKIYDLDQRRFDFILLRKCDEKHVQVEQLTFEEFRQEHV